MSFTKIAQAEQRKILDRKRQRSRADRGWYECHIPAKMLDELGIEYEVDDSVSAHDPDAKVYAPVWVYGIWFNAGMPTTEQNPKWAILKSLLVTTRDSLSEREMVTDELALESGIPAPARVAARNLSEVLHGHRKSKVSGEHS